ncbi:hypothetical protein VB264_14970 [Arcicella aquatica]|uniref:Virion structural protein n=1 Tax=Arcicella aquatica TaxID=217141 RepID=A0ABU5QPU7_9BACT|nr:hypothetical protein [Arcicella aquatica]MEA5259096.1 hypothetical protein [Arcicella aquatica]
MSYLNSPRLVFSGDFLSDVSTVNNDTAHYNNATFQPNFQEYGQGSSNGWWNPEGGAVFNFQNCKIHQLTMPSGFVINNAADDMLVGQIIAGSDGRPTGKMVDLDPDQQMVSALWCVQLRICTPQNEVLLQGDISTTSFRDIQMRQVQGAAINGQALGASWTSVLTNLVWGEKASSSPFLTLLKETTQGNKLSINLNAFGYYYAHAADGRFSLGRILGTIAPWYEGEPETFTPCRRLYGLYKLKPTSPWTCFGNSNFNFDKTAKKLTLDLGGSFPITDALGTISESSTLILGVSKKPLSNETLAILQYLNTDDFIEIGQVEYQRGTEWLNTTGGIVEFNNLPDNIVQPLSNQQLVLLIPSTTGKYALIAREAVDGVLVRADNFVLRIDTGQKPLVNFYSYQWGNPLPNANIYIVMEPPTPDTPVSINNPICELYGNNTPPEGLTFNQYLTTNDNGFGQLEITGNAIGYPRVYIDGQIYMIDYQTDVVDPAFGVESISVHLRSFYEVPENPTWDDISDTMIQYANLYPIMSKYIVNLANPEDVIARKEILLFAFTRGMNDTMHMPVTRDLSDAKRNAIIKWLNNPIISETSTLVKSEKTRGIERPISADIPASEQHLNYLASVKAKNGAMMSFPQVDNLFENI